MRINQNVLALRTQGQVAQTEGRLDKSIEKLSSGLRINRAADDAAGLAISEKLRRQIRGLSRAVLNAQDGISMIQTGEGALNESHSILQRMRELAIQASNDTLTSNDRLEIQKEVNQLRDDLNRIASNTEFNTKKLLDGSQTALFSSSSAAVNGMVMGGIGAAGDSSVSLALISGGISQMQRSQIFTVQGMNSVLAKGTTQLQSIAQFYDANGTFALQSPQTLNILGNSKMSSVQVDGQMTLDKLAAQIQNSLTASNGLEVKNSTVSMVNTATTRIAGVGGYLELVSGTVGDGGKFALSGDQGLMNALGIGETRAAVNNLVEGTLRDNNGNIRQVRTSSDRMVGLLEGVDLTFASQAAQIAGVGGLEGGLRLTAQQAFSVVVGNVFTVSMTIATGSWTLDGLIRNINAQIDAAAGAAGANGPEYARDLNAVVADGQIRLTWEPPASIATVTSTIVTRGASAAKTLGFLNGTSSGFTQGDKDETKIDWGFSRFVYSNQNSVGNATSIRFSIYDGNPTNTALTITVMQTLGTANVGVGDLVSFKTFQASVNALLLAATVQVRVDQVGGTMAFTALRVGQENRSNNTPIDSMVRIGVTSTDAGSDGIQVINSRFGIRDQQAMGSGDKNFLVHVVDNTPQFQIGADQGQAMKVNFADMSSRALDVDKLDMTTIAGAQNALAKINKAIDKVSSERSKLGAFQNRMEYAINNLKNIGTNLTAAEARLRDVDVSQEMIEFTRNQIISQSGMAMLAQANTIPQGVLQLLK